MVECPADGPHTENEQERQESGVGFDAQGEAEEGADADRSPPGGFFIPAGIGDDHQAEEDGFWHVLDVEVHIAPEAGEGCQKEDGQHAGEFPQTAGGEAVQQPQEDPCQQNGRQVEGADRRQPIQFV